MTAREIRRVLFAARPGAPEPSLLVWAAGVADDEDLPFLVDVAANASRLDEPDGWPVIADAVAEIVARRVTDPARRAALLGALAVELTGADPAPPAEAVYMRRAGSLPAGDTPWLVAAQAVRLVGSTDTDALLARTDLLPEPWAAHLRRLLARPRRPSRSAAEELRVAHVATVELAGLTPGTPRHELAAIARELIDELAGSSRGLGPAVQAPPGRPSRGPALERPTRGAQEPRPRASRWVGNGLATPDGTRWRRNRTAAPRSDYLYWFGIGERDPDDVDRVATELEIPSNTPGTVLDVVVFPFSDELELPGTARTGQLELRRDGTVGVLRQPGTADDPEGRRLLFPVQTPDRPGRHRLRCSVYCKQTLLQSRVLTVTMTERPETVEGAVEAVTDYVADSRLDTRRLDALGELTLSLFLNDDGFGTHQFRLFRGGDAPIAATTQLTEGDLQDLVDNVRTQLRKLTWGSPDEWTTKNSFRYAGTPDTAETDFEQNLIDLAAAGCHLWRKIAGILGESDALADDGAFGSPSDRVAALVRAPSSIEFANRYGARMSVPIGFVYDLPLDTQTADQVCPAALDAIGAHADLTDLACFQGACPTHAALGADAGRRVVCPGGFWAFRHALGLPLSRRFPSGTEQATDPPSIGVSPIRWTEQPRVVVGYATDLPGEHPEAVGARGVDSPVTADRTAFLRTLREGPRPNLLYLFCHGMVSPAGIPAVRIGPKGTAMITEVELGDGVWWGPDDEHDDCAGPLVVLNACRSAAVAPNRALELITTLVRDDAAAAVVGTEVTTYDILAERFATLLLDAFLVDGGELGTAMRRARLALLREGNPLGMIYTAYGPARLRVAVGPGVI